MNHIRMHPQPGDHLNLSAIQEGAKAIGVARPEEKTPTGLSTGLFPGTHSGITNPMYHPIPKLKVIHAFHPS
jgi:hypothetical protein